MRATLCVVLALSACNDKGSDSSGSGGDDSVGGGDTSDLDADGYTSPDDCDDGNAEIHPDASEVCDGVDNDCDGTIDVGATDAVEYWVDGDGDGYGAGKSELSCTAITGSVDNGDDCDDTRSDVNPAGTEVCDDADTDEDCDLLIDGDDDSLDPASAVTLYVDADGDSYGDPENAQASCDNTPGYVADATDCDDTSAAAHPGAEEICADGLDNDCDGTSNECGWTGELAEADADVEITGSAMSEGHFGWDLTSMDVNGDGQTDLVGSTLPAYATYGYAAIFTGPLTSTSVDKGATALITGSTTDRFGQNVQGLGDQDGDGYDELLVQAAQYPKGSYNGIAYVLNGPLSGTIDGAAEASTTFTGDNSFDQFGASPSMGDLDGDGTTDLVLGGVDDGAYVYYGPITTGDYTASDADATMIEYTAGAQLGEDNCANGDINADGIDDLAVGAPSVGGESGAVWLAYGPIAGEHDTSDADVIVTGAPSGAWLSACGTSGDLDGDGRDDLAVGGPYADSGYAWVFSGTSVPDKGELDVSKADAMIVGDAKTYDGFGDTIDTSGDLDNDGRDDLMVGSWLADSRYGSVWGYYGPVSGTLDATPDASFRINGEVADQLGYAAQVMPDLSGDGVDDLAVGAAYAHYYDYYGLVVVYDGRSI